MYKYVNHNDGTVLMGQNLKSVYKAVLHDRRKAFHYGEYIDSADIEYIAESGAKTIVYHFPAMDEMDNRLHLSVRAERFCKRANITAMSDIIRVGQAIEQGLLSNIGLRVRTELRTKARELITE